MYLKNYLIKYNFEWIVPLEEDDTESIKFMRSIKFYEYTGCTSSLEYVANVLNLQKENM